MSTRNVEHNQLITCDLCKRRYNINVYKRHRNENQCIKRNHHRLPFESIKQRSIQIGDKIFSIQQQSQKTNDREKRKQQISNNKQYQEKLQRIFPSNNRRRTLEQAKQLLERRTKYKPPWIQKRSNFRNEHRTNTTILQANHPSNNTVNQGISPKKVIQRFYSGERPSPPTTKFKNDDLPIKISDRHEHNHTISRQPIITNSPKIRTSQVSARSKYPSNRVDQTFSHKQTNSISRPTRKAYTWTRSSKQTPNRDVISPIHIPTFCESSSGPFDDQISIPFNQNYDEDEFERYSPTPPSTPKYHQEPIELKNLFPNIKQNQTLIRPNTYQKSKRSDHREQNDKILFNHSSTQTDRKDIHSTFHFPPIKHNPRPWR